MKTQNFSPFVWISCEKSHFKDGQRKIAIEKNIFKSLKRDILNRSARRTSICFNPLTYPVNGEYL